MRFDLGLFGFWGLASANKEELCIITGLGLEIHDKLLIGWGSFRNPVGYESMAVTTSSNISRCFRERPLRAVIFACRESCLYPWLLRQRVLLGCLERGHIAPLVHLLRICCLEHHRKRNSTRGELSPTPGLLDTFWNLKALSAKKQHLKPFPSWTLQTQTSTSSCRRSQLI